MLEEGEGRGGEEGVSVFLSDFKVDCVPRYSLFTSSLTTVHLALWSVLPHLNSSMCPTAHCWLLVMVVAKSAVAL